ncbi:hypothetical protein EV193_113142 [Herbihabitans rhizosphaerae]|uniref:Uncharacterized protein n=2 Tax=Herbihabitans rhizosphaerae TaxID=1872711 RepID=A0A4Q7KHG2_9PSEU|nr:hypothetical protein [Herbihabitans rhizosphaerae]RZS32298.1 hypothetical protein EV193_113142 [Herbihabitans rhizosphaerae]
MHVNWGALVSVLVVSLAVVVGLVLLFGLGLRGIAARDGRSPVPGVALAAVAFAGCAAVIGLGIYVIVS